MTKAYIVIELVLNPYNYNQDTYILQIHGICKFIKSIIQALTYTNASMG